MSGDPKAEHSHHVMPLTIYYGVFGALIFLTFITVLVSYLNLGPAAIFAALAVALVKAGLVVGFFMHLRYENRFLSLVFFGSVVFLLIFFVFTFIDLEARDALIDEHASFKPRDEKALVSRLQRAAELREQQKTENAPGAAAAGKATEEAQN